MALLLLPLVSGSAEEVTTTHWEASFPVRKPCPISRSRPSPAPFCRNSADILQKAHTVEHAACANPRGGNFCPHPLLWTSRDPTRSPHTPDSPPARVARARGRLPEPLSHCSDCSRTLIAQVYVVQLQLTKSEENESLMGRTSDPRLDKVLALIDRGIAPETALQRHGNPVSLEHLKYRVLKQRDAPPDDEPRHGSRRPSKASTSTPSARSAGKQPARPMEHVLDLDDYAKSNADDVGSWCLRRALPRGRAALGRRLRRRGKARPWTSTR